MKDAETEKVSSWSSSGYNLYRVALNGESGLYRLSKLKLIIKINE